MLPWQLSPSILKPKLGEKKSLWFSLTILVAIFLFLLVKNFPFNLWYTGWDNLHPEFNFGMNFRRALSAVWQTNQGLGTYGGHGYAATLPHTITLYLMSFFIPLKYLRASFTFLTLLTGSLGVFFLVRKIINKEEILKNFGALTGAVFYLLNLATVQNFYIQLEAFIVHFAFLPWLFLTLIKFLESNRKKDLAVFCLVTVVASAQGFVPPLLFVYLIILTIFLIAYAINRFSWQKVSRAALVFLLTIFLNAYWLFPVIYYSLTHSETYLNSYNNINSTEDFIIKNQKYGTIDNVALLKGFLLEAIDIGENNLVFQIFKPWNDHFKNRGIKISGYLLFSIIIVGLFTNLKRREHFYSWGILFSFLIIFSLLVTATPPFSFLTKIIQKIPVLRQAFRVAYTKFSLVLAFLYSVCFGLGCLTLLGLVKRYLKKPIFIFFVTTIFVAINLNYCLPALKGYLLYGRTKLNLPDIYFQLFDYYKNQNKQIRIANFPQGWHWGWSLYKWGYSGSGFLWYGIKQPILDRAFDVWGEANENYYWEITQAIYSENFADLEKIFEKYQVSQILFDHNVVPYPNVKGFLYSDKLEKYLDSAERFKLVKSFVPNDKNVEKINIYEFALGDSSKSFGLIKENLRGIGPVYQFDNKDQAFFEFGDYYLTSDQSEVFYPFRTLFFGRTIGAFPIEIVDQGDFLLFKSGIGKDLSGKRIEYLRLEGKESTTSSIYIQESDVIAEFEKKLIYDSKSDLNFYDHTPVNCGISQGSKGTLTQEIIDNDFLRFISLDSDNCYTIELKDLPQRFSYLVKIENRYFEGKRLQFAVVNHDSRKADLELQLTDKNNFESNYAVIPPMKDFGLGYSLSFNNVSTTEKKSINDLRRITIYQIPYQTLKSIKIINDDSVAKENQWLVYSQSFDSDWLALEKTGSFSFRKLDNHVLVNNWENGWRLPSISTPSTIYIFFWPQVLEYLGFVLLLLTPGIIWKSKFDSRAV